MSLKGTLVLRYSDNLQKYFKLKTKPEPWLHLGYTTSFDKKTGKATTHIAIFVWDTRQIVEYAEPNISLPPGGVNAKLKARDNGEPLKGKGAEWFNGNGDDKTKPAMSAKVQAACQDAWQSYQNAHDALYRNMETKDSKTMSKQHEVMMRAVRKLGKLGVQHRMPEWAKYDGRRGLFRDEEVKCPDWLFK